MNISKLFSHIFAVLGAVLAICALALCFASLDASPRLLKTPGAAVDAADAMMTAVCEGDYASASGRMFGNPDLGVDREPADPVAALIWNAFLDSLDYELVGSCYATDSGVAQNVTITCLDISSVTSVLGERSQALLSQRVREAEDVSEIYDDNNEYREDFVMEVLYDAAVEALAEDAKTTTQDVTLNLIYDRSQWKIMPEAALLSAISGGIAG